MNFRFGWIGLDRIFLTRRAVSCSPGFTSAAVAALAVGIGASTAVFSFVDRVLFRPLPYVHEHEWVGFGMTAPIGRETELILDQTI